MKKNSKKVILATLMALAMVASATIVAGATDNPDWSRIYVPIVNLIDSMLIPILLIVGAVGAIFCVFLGVKFAKADDPQEHEKAKKGLKNAIIGFVLIFVLIGAIKLAMPVMRDWLTGYEQSTSSPEVTETVTPTPKA